MIDPCTQTFWWPNIFRYESCWYSNVINHPPFITIFMGGTNHQFYGWLMTLLDPHFVYDYMIIILNQSPYSIALCWGTPGSHACSLRAGTTSIRARWKRPIFSKRFAKVHTSPKETERVRRLFGILFSGIYYHILSYIIM